MVALNIYMVAVSAGAPHKHGGQVYPLCAGEAGVVDHVGILGLRPSLLFESLRPVLRCRNAADVAASPS